MTEGCKKDPSALMLWTIHELGSIQDEVVCCYMPSHYCMTQINTAECAVKLFIEHQTHLCDQT